MITLIKNGEVYAPHYLGKKDILLAGGKIEAICESIPVPKDFISIKVIDASGMIVFPGLIDPHVHILGGGGEGGFKTRTPEIKLSDIIAGGTTTVVGCLGTDGVCRDMKSLLAKARGLEEEGLTTYIYTGSYELPTHTITENCRTDIMLIDKIIGVGELALSDHRSSQPTFDDFIKVVAEARVAGMLSGKAGIVNVHLGDGERRLKFLIDMAEKTEIPIKQVIPTHINRSREVFEAGIEFAKLDGIIDFTTSYDTSYSEMDEITASKGLKLALEAGIPIEQIQFSSDGQGSLPIFNEKKEYIGLGVGSAKSLYNEVKAAIIDYGVSIENALKVVTSNTAKNLKLNNKGSLAEGKAADIVIANKNNLNVEYVLAKGTIMMSEGILIVKGTFEEP